MKSKQIA